MATYLRGGYGSPYVYATDMAPPSKYLRGSGGAKTVINVRRKRLLRPQRSLSSPHYYEFTIPVSIPWVTATTGLTGFNLPGTTAATSSPGIYWQFSPTSVRVRNANGGDSPLTIPNSTYYPNLYDQCRLKAVKMRGFCNTNMVSASASNLGFGVLQVAEDNDFGGMVAPATKNDLADRRLRTFNPTAVNANKDGSFMHITAHPRLSAQSGGANADIITRAGQWLSCANNGATDTQNGVLMYFDCPTQILGPETLYFQFYITLCVEFKSIR